MINLKRVDGWLIKSRLITNQRTGIRLPHHNLTSPRFYLTDALTDIIRCAGVRADPVVVATLFSRRPDLVMIRFQGQTLFAIEVKNPGIPDIKGPDKNVFTAESVAGWTLDYLKGLK